MASRRKLKLETRYRNLLRDARILTTMLDLAGRKLSQAARAIEGQSPLVGEHPTPSELREWSSECARIAHQRGRAGC